MSNFRPFVLELGEHLDGWGNVCRCRRGLPAEKPQNPCPIIKTEPPVPSVPQRRRVPTWADHELDLARRRGVEVWIHSEMRG
jgi:hypothetical protein